MVTSRLLTVHSTETAFLDLLDVTKRPLGSADEGLVSDLTLPDLSAVLYTLNRTAPLARLHDKLCCNDSQLQ